MILFLASLSYSDDDVISGHGSPIAGAETILGVTDDVNLNLKLLRTDSSGYLKVNLAVGGITGSVTPSDNFTNPTNAFSTWSLLGGWDSSGGNWDRVRIDTNGSLYVNPGALSYTTDTISTYPPAPGYSHITTATNTQVKSSAGYLFRILINKAGAASTTATVYDNTSCATTVVAVIDTSAIASFGYGLYAGTGICITTSGTPDITVVYK